MKHYTRILLALLWSTGILISCNKDANHKDHSASIKGKTWWGLFTYAGNKPEYYSVHFNEDNSLDWNQLPGDDGGQWMLDGKRLTISLTRNNVKIQADISNDNKLENIADNTDKYEINSGQLITNPKLSLENTVWKGTWSTVPYEISFGKDSKIIEKVSALDYGHDYTRSPSGAVIRYKGVLGYSFMCVITSDNAMNGRDDLGDMVELVKQ